MPPIRAQASAVASQAMPDSAAAVQPLPLPLMARFKRLMQYEGWDVDVPRMCVDAAYAHDCLATAHTSGDERLRQAALCLFETYGRNAEAPVLH